jgi:hypothetical protein
MVHTIYKITNKVNGKIYIGKHSCSSIDEEDGYMGSGKIIKKSIEKYGIENFTKEILFVFDDEIMAYDKEKEIVNEEFVKRKDVYNLIIGGDSFFAINSNKELRIEKNKRAAISMNRIIWNDPEFRKRSKNRMIEQNQKLHSLGILKAPDWTGKSHKEETKRKIGDKNSESQKGCKNSQYGTCWVYHNEHGNKKIKKEELDEYLKYDWIKGRKLK